MLIAGGSKAAARRAAKYGLGFISQISQTIHPHSRTSTKRNAVPTAMSRA